ncbi:MAG TPA: SGNH hydrolase domain-containing protein [Acidimicrobiales bacterium]|nr:SGNH hydrolase domain-containing protein [Acidimicrobiales bacterium]
MGDIMDSAEVPAGLPRGARASLALVLILLAALMSRGADASDVAAVPVAKARPAAVRPVAPAPVVAPTAPVAAPVPALVAPAPAPPPAAPHPVMFIGDSMAFTAADALAPHALPRGFTVANEGIFGCGVVRGGPYRYFGAQHDLMAHCADWPARWQAAVERNRPELVAMFVGRWELMDRVHDGRWTNIGDPAFAAYVESELDQAITIAGSTGARPVLFTAPYYRRGITAIGGLFPEDDPARVDAVNALIHRVADRRGVAVLDVGHWLSPEGRYTADVNGIRVRSDGVHLTRATGDVLAPLLFPALEEILRTPRPAPAHIQ